MNPNYITVTIDGVKYSGFPKYISYVIKYKAVNKQVKAIMADFRNKYGRNWTKSDLSKGDDRKFRSLLRQQTYYSKKALEYGKV